MDEREIEAVAAEAREIAAVVANDEKFHRIETLIDQLEDAALDRVRDARGDDEVHLSDKARAMIVSRQIMGDDDDR
jgi:hypothetical protein